MPRIGPRRTAACAGRTGDSFPVRTCVGCRQRDRAAALVRLKACGGTVEVAAGGVVGRGAWLHPHPACVRRALRRGALSGALRAVVSIDAEALCVLVGAEKEDGPEIPGLTDTESGLEADGHPMSSQR